MESPWIVADTIEATEFPELARRYGVRGVPRTIVNEREAIEGAVPEAAFLRTVLAAAGLPWPAQADGAGQLDATGPGPGRLGPVSSREGVPEP